MSIEDIKKEVLNRIKGIKEYKKIPEKEIIQWIDEIPASEFEPHTINEEKEEIDEDNLLDRKVSDIIDFLSQYKDRDYILEEWDSLQNEELTPNMVTWGSHKRIHWKCSKGHTWEAVIKERTKINGNRCPICRKEL